MTYWLINVPFLVFAAVVAVIAVALVARRRREGFRAVAVALTLGIVLIMTAIFDNIMIGVGLVGYDTDRISGQFIGIAPLEDFAYAVAAVVMLPALWVILSPRVDAGSGSRT
ncbi:lycopene cyclase domain-containing protein [Marisediminicola sp. LYQ134]|uniref:lycopene cyclase domain-containing protein n=1 Tax=unclassified Marisediminicola TaxID=2618316 RepID=UPI003983D7AF